MSAAVILAAGKSTRMKSDTPKVLHPICGRLMIDYVLDAVRAAGVDRITVVVGYQADRVEAALAHHHDVTFALQAEQLGTGHAVLVCEDALKDHDGSVLVLAGDTPLLRSESLKSLLDEQQQAKAACVVGSADTANNKGLGRIVRDSSGAFVKIVEQKDATAEEDRITEINTGCYAFDNQAMLAALHKIRPNNKQAEYYLTDTPRILMDEGRMVTASCSLTIEEALGVNTRVQLAEARQPIQAAILQRLMLDGVSIVDPSATVIDASVSIGQDSTVHPFSVITGDVSIGSNCTIGPFANIVGPVTIDDGTTVP